MRSLVACGCDHVMSKAKLSFVTIFVVTLVVLFVIHMNLQHLSHLKVYFRSEKTFKILLWTQYYSSHDWLKSLKSDLNCDYSNCVLTSDRTDLMSNDVLVFHWRDIDVLDLPSVAKPSHQTWVLFNMESPVYTYMKFPAKLVDIDLFESIDWLMSYRSESDVFSPYGQVVKCDTHWMPKYKLKDKPKQIAWIVSHCETSSQREVLVQQLKKFIDVDIYGSCGSMPCIDNQSCLHMIEQNYKFYLSFENSLCKDYVTEKLFRTLEYDIIPIVLGSADYKTLLPHNSYIDALNFSTVSQLSDYLIRVSANERLYQSYLQWKKDFCVRRLDDNYFCQLCAELNQNNRQTNRKISDNLVKWWVETAECRTIDLF